MTTFEQKRGVKKGGGKACYRKNSQDPLLPQPPDEFTFESKMRAHEAGHFGAAEQNDPAVRYILHSFEQYRAQTIVVENLKPVRRSVSQIQFIDGPDPNGKTLATTFPIFEDLGLELEIERLSVLVFR